MPFKIQRVPRGLGNMLSSFGGLTPAELEDRIRGTVDLTQFYGNQQRQVLSAANAGFAASLTVPAAAVTPSASSWSILFAAMGTITPVAAATTHVGFGIGLVRPGADTIMLEARDLVPVVASNLVLSFLASYPFLIPPGASVGLMLYSTLGSATQTGGITVDFGVLG